MLNSGAQNFSNLRFWRIWLLFVLKLSSNMYSVSLLPWGQHQLLSFKNEATGAMASFIPTLGVALNQVILPNKAGVPMAVTLGTDDPEVYLAEGVNTYWGTLLFPFPNRIKDGQYAYAGQSYTLAQNHAAEGHAIHGLVYNVPFEVQYLEGNAREAKAVMAYRYLGDDAAYPWPHYLEVTVRFTDVLHISTTIINTGKETMPCGLGWHPYISTGNSVNQWRVSLPVQELLPVDDRMIPTSEREDASHFQEYKTFADTHLDTCFTVAPNAPGRAVVRIEDPAAQLELEISQETGAGLYNYLQVYSPANRMSIAIEPMTCPPNVLNSGEQLWQLAPDETRTVSWSIKSI